MKRHEIPTHLDTPDRFLAGLTAKQAMELMAAAASSYGLLDNQGLPHEVRLSLVAATLVFGLVAALFRPAGRPIEEWAVLAGYYLATPRLMVWRPCPVPEEDIQAAWSDVVPRIEWAAPSLLSEEAGHSC